MNCEVLLSNTSFEPTVTHTDNVESFMYTLCTFLIQKVSVPRETPFGHEKSLSTAQYYNTSSQDQLLNSVYGYILHYVVHCIQYAWSSARFDHQRNNTT